MQATELEESKVDEIIERYSGEDGVLIQVLLDVQNFYNWLPEHSLRRISERLSIPLSEVYRTASFYKALSLTPKGRHTIKVCMGTACHVRGGRRILDKIEEFLKVKTDETTEDMRFTLERVNCLGCCALGPAMVVDSDTHGNLSVSQVEGILSQYS